MAKVGLIMGSESDREVVKEAVPYLDYFGIEYDMQVMSAHRTPARVQEFAAGAQENGFDVLIACAGMAAHLPGVVAAYTTLPVIGVPLAAGPLQGQDALYAIVQMPAGVPVATMAIGKAGVRNAAIFSAQIIARSREQVAGRLFEFKKNQCKLPK
ncbi:MAG: 5-(carboxyamino)imidazole ribonucleotide mutase [Calditrichia bacterium]